jgi:hypothetical protein
MNAGFILAIGLILFAGLAVAILVARRAGAGGEDASIRYGRELEPELRRGRPDWTPDRRRRAKLAVLAAALASIGAGMASFLATAAGKH